LESHNNVKLETAYLPQSHSNMMHFNTLQ